MNIFIMILVALFMGTYYLISSPSLRVREQEIEHSITRADMRSNAQRPCTMRQLADMNLMIFVLNKSVSKAKSSVWILKSQ